jgi:hypothetical protein
MKTLLFLFLVSGNIISQSFTNGSVYNFSVGDTIVTEITNYYGQITAKAMIYRVVAGKHFSAQNDTVFYECYDYYYVPVNCMTCTASWTKVNNTFYITDLTSSAINYTLAGKDNCQVTKDSSYLNTCGLHEHLKYVTPPGCFEGPTIEDRIIEGVGILSYSRCWNCMPAGSGGGSKLVSFHKAEGIKCGNVAFIPVGIPENYENDLVNIFPNPGNGQFWVKSSAGGELYIKNQLGQTIYAGNVSPGENSVNITGCEAGIYFVNLRVHNAIFSKKLVKF